MNVFDILGPVMIGPSSSHTAGALDQSDDKGSSWKTPVKAHIFLHGSLRKPIRDTARIRLLAGIQMQTDDERIRFP